MCCAGSTSQSRSASGDGSGSGSYSRTTSASISSRSASYTGTVLMHPWLQGLQAKGSVAHCLCIAVTSGIEVCDLFSVKLKHLETLYESKRDRHVFAVNNLLLAVEIC